jgi:hypothetical protein
MTSAPKDSEWVNKLSKWHLVTACLLFGVSGVICLVAGLYRLICLPSLELGLATLGAGLALLFASLFGHFESFKIWGVEGKIKQLNETVDKAEEALAQLRSLTNLTGEALMRLYCGLGRYTEPPSLLELDAIAGNVRALLTEAGRSEQQVREMLAPWVSTMSVAAHKNVRERLDAILGPLRIDLINRKFIAEPNELLTLVPRIESVEGYTAKEADKIRRCSAEEVSIRIISIITEAPELTDKQRDELMQFASQASEEVRYLAANYALRDKTFWGSLAFQ